MFDANRVNEMTQSSVIDALDLSMFTERDILNTILQRSEVLFDLEHPGVPIRQWSNGNPKALEAEVASRGPLLLKRAISVLYLEFLALKSFFDQLKLKRVADIGCGYGFIDLFIAKEYKSAITLIDLEENDATHFGFQSEGAAYSSLSTAKKFLTANGIPSRKVKTINPGKDDPNKINNIDLALSLLSCGFHYPANTYRSFWEDSVSKDGAIILDLRVAHAEGQLTELIHIGAVRALWRGEKWNRVLVQKSGP